MYRLPGPARRGAPPGVSDGCSQPSRPPARAKARARCPRSTYVLGAYQVRLSPKTSSVSYCSLSASDVGLQGIRARRATRQGLPRTKPRAGVLIAWELAALNALPQQLAPAAVYSCIPYVTPAGCRRWGGGEGEPESTFRAPITPPVPPPSPPALYYGYYHY